MTESTTTLAIRETLPPPLERVSIHITPSSDPEKIRDTLLKLASSSVDVDHAGRALKFWVGKSCLMIKQRRLFKLYGYRSNEAFLKAEIYRPRLTHGTVWKGIRAVRAFPQATAEQLAAIPERNLTLAAKIVLRDHLRTRPALRLLAEAESLKPLDFEDAHGVEAAKTGFAVIRVVTSKAFKKQFEQCAGEDPEQFLREVVRRPPQKSLTARRTTVAA